MFSRMKLKIWNEKCMKENRQNTARDLNIKIKYEASGAGEILETIWKFPDWASTSSSDHLLPFQKDDVRKGKLSKRTTNWWTRLLHHNNVHNNQTWSGKAIWICDQQERLSRASSSSGPWKKRVTVFFRKFHMCRAHCALVRFLNPPDSLKKSIVKVYIGQKGWFSVWSMIVGIAPFLHHLLGGIRG